MENEKIVQAHAIANFSAQIASAAGIDDAIETNLFNDKGSGERADDDREFKH
jgi:hypothetical protein